MDEKKKTVFLPDLRAPEVTAENVEHVTLRVRIPTKNAYLWHYRKEHGLIPFVGSNSRLPSGDVEVLWWPALTASLLLEQLKESVDPLAISLRTASELERDFVDWAKHRLDTVRGYILDKDPDHAMKIYLEQERKKLTSGC